MQTAVLNNHSQQLALSLHALLDEIDPIRWHEEKAASLRSSLEEIERQACALREAYAEAADQQIVALRLRIEALAEICRAHAPPSHFAGAQGARAEELREAWMRFRAEAETAYEALAASLRAVDHSVPSLRPSNLKRNAFHVGAAAVAIAAIHLVPWLAGGRWWPAVAIATTLALSGWSMELGRRHSEKVNALLMWILGPVAHPHERHRINSSTWFTSALALLSLTGSPVIVTAALAVLGVGDPVAALVGKRFGRHKIINNRSLEGSLAFLAAGAVVALGALLMFFGDTLGLGAMVLVALSASGAGAVAELLSRRVDDNLSIPLAAAAGAALALGLLGLPLA